MTQTSASAPATQANNNAADIAWTVIKVILYLIRFWIGGFCLLAALGAAVAVFNGSETVWHAFILLVFGLIIWPQRYNPLFRRLGRRQLPPSTEA